jgi:hypothetical protein
MHIGEDRALAHRQLVVIARPGRREWPASRVIPSRSSSWRGTPRRVWLTLASSAFRVKYEPVDQGRKMCPQDRSSSSRDRLETTWACWLTGFLSLSLHQTYLRRTGGIWRPQVRSGSLTSHVCIGLVRSYMVSKLVNLQSPSATSVAHARSNRLWSTDQQSSCRGRRYGEGRR